MGAAYDARVLISCDHVCGTSSKAASPSRQSCIEFLREVPVSAVPA